jgi:hypothetical protein
MAQLTEFGYPTFVRLHASFRLHASLNVCQDTGRIVD